MTALRHQSPFVLLLGLDIRLRDRLPRGRHTACRRRL